MTDPTSNQKLYAERDHYQLSPQYERHLLAMTAEGLYSKSAIAAELAYRDIEIERLRPMAESWESYEAAQERKAEMQPVETSAVPSHEALADHLKTLTASTNCPVCGKSGMHEHTPTELIIYRNGVKYGRSLYETAPVGTPRIGQCEATVPPKWHTPEHRCEFEATTEINGQKLCGHHLKSSPLEPTPNQDGQQTPAPSGHAGLGTTGQSPSAVRSSENGERKQT